jgi:tetratricopeptide (TPR) repeat protein
VYAAVLFSDLERHSVAWSRVRREDMIGAIAEYRFLAESLAGQYGCLYPEWAGDGHMFLFASADVAVRFALDLVDRWRGARASSPALRSLPRLPLRLGCHFGECTAIDGPGWIGRCNAVAKRVEAEAEPDTLYVTGTLLDLLDLPLYSFDPVGARPLKGDALPERALYRIVAFNREALEARPAAQLTAEDWFLKAVSLIGTAREWGEEETVCYERAIELRPDYAEAHCNLGVILRARGANGEAAKHYQEALRLRPDYAEAHRNYAVLLAGRSSSAGAAEHFGEALRLRPEDAAAHHGLAGLMHAKGELEGAAEHYEHALRLRPDYPEAHSNYAILLEDLGRLQAAEAHYEEALALRPDYPEALYNYALLLERLGDTAGSERRYREALRLWPDYAEAHNNLAAMLHRRGKHSQAVEHYRQALRLRPDDPEVHHNYALLLQSLGDDAEARVHARIARELLPEQLAFRSTLDAPT